MELLNVICYMLLWCIYKKDHMKILYGTKPYQWFETIMELQYLITQYDNIQFNAFETKQLYSIVNNRWLW